jgi:hypothetical protein
VPGREPTTGGIELDDLGDRVIAAALAAGAARGTIARPSTRTFGDVAWPVLEVTGQMLVNHCDLPQPISASASRNGG